MKTAIASKKRLLLVGLAFVLLAGGTLLALPRLHGADDCTSVEQYDVLRDECYFDCDSDQQCAALSKQVDKELSESFDSATTKPASQKPTAPQPAGSGSLYTLQSTGSETKGTVYTVQSDGSLRPAPSKAHAQLWSLINELLGTTRVKQRIVSFEVFNDENNDTAASVWRSDDPAKWHMNINQAFANDDKKDLLRTIIHEYGHIVTLSDNQVASVSGTCPRIQLDEGCGNPGSYINAYYASFWKDYGFSADEVGSISEKDAGDLYASEPDSFVSEYASTNITEDIAESFADFVTKAKPAGGSVKAQKVRFFYRYPELVSLREQLRVASAKILQ